MACEAFNRAMGFTPTSDFTNDVAPAVYNEGVGCVNANMASCATQCQDLTKTATACYSCLGQYASCPSQACTQKQVDCSSAPDDECCQNASGSCCPLAQLAVQCGSCIAANGSGQSSASWNACSQSSGLSSKTTIIIVVCCVVAAVVVIAVVVVVIKLKRQARARQKLLRHLQDTGVDERIVQNVANLNYSRINSQIFHDADVHIALHQASNRVQPLPPPRNVAVSQLASESEGLFAL